MPEAFDSTSGLSPAEKLRFEAAISDFEMAWLQQPEPPLERFLPGAGAIRQVLLPELVRIDMEFRRGRGETIDQRDYVARFPDLVVNELLSNEAADAATLGFGSATTSQPGNQSGPAQEIPKTFGRYDILKPLGQGAMGVVYLAHDRQLDRPVALKIPKVGQLRGELVVQRFYREAQAAGNLRHSNICPVYDVGQIEGAHYLAMAYIPGKSLSQVLRDEGPLAPEKAARLIRDVAGAVHEAHVAGIVHRDLKPGNILIDERGQPIVMDFGLAHRKESATEQLTHAGEILGTPAYMAPEQVRGEAVGPSSDIYSLGATLYELLTGKPPFSGSHIAGVLSGVLTQVPQPPHEHSAAVPRALSEICVTALKKLPADRYSSAKELAQTLDQWLNSGRLTRVPPRRSRAVSFSPLQTVAAVVAIVALTGVAVLFSQRPSAAPVGNPPARAVTVPTPVTPTESGPQVAVNSAPAARVEPPTVPGKQGKIQMEVIVQPAELSSGHRVLTPRQLPLHNGDKLQLHVTMADPAYLYVFWLDGNGKLQRMFPPNLEKQQAVTEVYEPPLADDPKQQTWNILGGAPASEFILAATSKTPLDSADLLGVERLTIRLGEPDRNVNSSTVWLKDVPVHDWQVIRPSDSRPVRLREVVGQKKSDRGKPIIPDPIDVHLDAFSDFYGLLAPRQ